MSLDKVFFGRNLIKIQKIIGYPKMLVTLMMTNKHHFFDNFFNFHL